MFVFDRVAHYHIPLFRSLKKRLEDDGHSLLLLSGKEKLNATGRVSEKNRVLENENKYEVYEMNINNYTLRYGKGVLGKIRAQKPDIVVIPSHVGNVLHWMIQSLAKKKGYKIISWQCGYEYNKSIIKDAILKIFLKRFDYHLAYHSNAKKYCVSLGVPDNRVTIMHNTIDETHIVLTDRFTAKKYLFEKYPMIKNRKIMLYVGAILKEKKIELILNSLSLMKRKDSAFVAVGDGPHLSKLKERFVNRNDVIFAGRVVDEVGYYFDAADIFVLPGTGGLALNEAMYHGLPIISGYADGSADDLVIHGKNGYRISEYSAEELVGYISNILEDDDLRERMGKESARMITCLFSFKKFINTVCSVLNQNDIGK